MDYETHRERRIDHLKKVIERKTGRALEEVVREMCLDRAQTTAQVACAFTRLTGEEVGVAVVEQWLLDYRLVDRAARWSALVPRVKALFDRLVQEETTRRMMKY